MKRIIMTLAVITASLSAQAQTPAKSSSTANKPFRFSIGLETAVPVGELSDAYSFGIGGSGEGIYQVDPSLGLTLNAGYIYYNGKDYEYKIGNVVYTVKDQAQAVIPIMAGIKYNFTPKFFGSAQLGTGIFLSDKDVANSKSTATFAYAPGIGYKFSENFDALLKYQSFSKNSVNTGFLGLRLAYTF